MVNRNLGADRHSRPEGGEALLDTDDGRGRLVISVNLLGRSVAAEVDEADVARA